MIPRRTPFIFLTFLFLLLFFGCREEGNPSTPSTVSMETPQDPIEAQIKKELQEELARLGVEPPLAVSTTSAANKSPKTQLMTVKEEINETLKEAERIDDSRKKEAIHVDLIKRLTLLREYNEATTLVPLVRDVRESDSLLEDIARIRMSDVLQDYAILHQLSDRNRANIQGALESVRRINDPVRKAKMLGNIAFFQANMKDQVGCLQTTRETIGSVQCFPDDDPRKAQGLVKLARLLIRIERNEDAEILCRKVQSLSAFIGPVEDRVRILTKLADLFVQLREHSQARTVCLEGIALDQKIDDPKKKSFLLFDLIDVYLRVHVTEKDSSPEELLKETRQIVLAAATAIPADVSEPVESAAVRSVATVDWENEGGLLLSREDDEPLSWLKIKTKKNETLRTIATMQAWQGTLEDVWETVENIDDSDIRDNAVAETIEMMIATKIWEDAVGWSDEISDPTLRKAIRRKIKNAMAENDKSRKGLEQK